MIWLCFSLEAPSIVGGGKDKAQAQAQALAAFNPAAAPLDHGQNPEKDKDTASAEREYRAAIEASHGSSQSWLHLAQFFAHTKHLDEWRRPFARSGVEPG